ncbi:MAG: hypothetical protein IKI75_05115 [Lachnospiraceae bacterium]|nr:hypothetical protein [Lachnospiraceae bacterium]
MSLKSFYRKTRTLIAGDLREIEKNRQDARNAKVLEKYGGREDIYCVLRMYSDEGGLFNYFLKGLSGISYSIQHGYIPVMDMQTKENIFVSDAQRKDTNVWEAFFEQPAGVSFAEVKNKKNVIVLENLRMPEGGLLHLTRQPQQSAYWRKLCKKYLHFSKPVLEEIDKYKAAFDSKKRWLGVLARGTDYLSLGVGHAVQPDKDTLIEKLRAVKEEYSCDGVFAATEDEELLDILKESFGDSLMYLDQKRYRGKQEVKLGQQADYRENAIAMNITYLAAIWYLSRCNCLVTANTGGATGAYILSEGYEYIHCWFLGTMGSTDPGTLDINKI